MTLLMLVLCSGSTGFIAYVLTDSDVFRTPRLWIMNQVPKQWWIKLWSCRICMSFWVGGVVASIGWASNGSAWFFWPAVVLSGAYLVVVTS